MKWTNSHMFWMMYVYIYMCLNEYNHSVKLKSYNVQNINLEFYCGNKSNSSTMYKCMLKAISGLFKVKILSYFSIGMWRHTTGTSPTNWYIDRILSSITFFSNHVSLYGQFQITWARSQIELSWWECMFVCDHVTTLGSTDFRCAVLWRLIF